MNYETELIELMPMLKSYLKTLMRASNPDIDDAFQECMLNAMESSTRNGIRNPRRYFIGVFDKTIKRICSREIREYRARAEMKKQVKEIVESSGDEGLLSQIDQAVSAKPVMTKTIWHFLKQFEGDKKKTGNAVGCHLQTIYYHQRKLRDIYEGVLCD